MKIRYRSNLTAGIAAILFGIALFWLIPAQVGVERRAVYGVNSRTLPYALAWLSCICGAGLMLQSLVFKRDEVKELELGKEAKGLVYMLMILAYGIGVEHSFLVATMLLGTATLAMQKDKKPLHYAIVIVTSVVIWFTFTQLLHVRLP